MTRSLAERQAFAIARAKSAAPPSTWGSWPRSTPRWPRWAGAGLALYRCEIKRTRAKR